MWSGKEIQQAAYHLKAKINLLAGWEVGKLQQVF
jgi:hypothetical protein